MGCYMGVYERGRVNVAESFWTHRAKACDHAPMAAADPLLVMRRHVDLLRVRSAQCRRAY